MTARSPTSNQVLYQEWLSFAGAKQLPASAIEQRTVTTTAVTFSESLAVGVPYRLSLSGDPADGGAMFTFNGTNPALAAVTGSAVGVPLHPNTEIEFIAVSGSQQLKVIKRANSGVITLYSLSNKVLVPGLES